MVKRNVACLSMVSDSRRIYEIAAVLLTACGKFLFMDLLQWKLAYISVSIALWSCYVMYRKNAAPGILHYWGFRTDNFREVAATLLPFAVVAGAVFVVVGYQRGTVVWTWHIVPLLMLYPVWGVIQQFLVIGLVGGNLQQMNGGKLNRFVVITVTALLFGLLHYPNFWLIAGTFILALLYGFVYLRGRNLFVLGLFHGWLGALYFYTLVGRDPFEEVFGKQFHRLLTFG